MGQRDALNAERAGVTALFSRYIIGEWESRTLLLVATD